MTATNTELGDLRMVGEVVWPTATTYSILGVEKGWGEWAMGCWVVLGCKSVKGKWRIPKHKKAFACAQLAGVRSKLRASLWTTLVQFVQKVLA